MEAISVWNLASAVSKLASLAGTAGVVGGFFALGLARTFSSATRHRLRIYVLFSAVLGLAATIVFFLVQIGAINQQGFAGIWDIQMGRILADSSLGQSTGLKLLAFLLFALSATLVSLRDRRAMGQVWKAALICIVAIALILLSASFLLTGHVTELGVLPHVAIVLHVLAVFLWIGALWPLLFFCTQLQQQPQELQKVMLLFGAIASGIVAVLIVSGVYFLSQLLDSWSDLIGTAYGRGILFKLSGVSLLLSLAALNKFRLVPQLERAGGTRNLARSIRLEILVALAILLITAVVTVVIGQ